jgi:hypothetical protein
MVEADIPTCIWGAPGIGKSSMAESLGPILGRHVETVIASLYDPTEFVGTKWISPTTGASTLIPSDFAVRCAQSEKSILLLDEVSQASPATQAALMRLVLNRICGSLSLGTGCAVLLAANSPDVAAGGWEIEAPLANRMAHVTAVADLAHCRAGFTTGWPKPTCTSLPSGWQAGIARQEALVASFWDVRPELLEEATPARGTRLSYATPRSWGMVARFVAAAKAAGYGFHDAIVEAGIVGLIGEAGKEFLAWVVTQDLIDPEILLADPHGAALPVRGDKLAAVLDGVITAALRNGPSGQPHPQQKARVVAAWQVLGRVAETTSVDVGVPSALRMAGQCNERKIPMDGPSAAKYRACLTAAGLMPKPAAA